MGEKKALSKFRSIKNNLFKILTKPLLKESSGILNVKKYLGQNQDKYCTKTTHTHNDEFLLFFFFFFLLYLRQQEVVQRTSHISRHIRDPVFAHFIGTQKTCCCLMSYNVTCVDGMVYIFNRTTFFFYS